MASPGQGYSAGAFNVFSELVTTTHRAHLKEISDNVSNHNALYGKLTKSGKIRMIDSGISIATPLEYAVNSTYQRYSGFDILSTAAVDVITAAEFPWRNVNVSLAISGSEIRINRGENQIIDLVKAKLNNARHSMANGLSTDFYSDGTLTNQVNGIQALVADTGTGTVGGISSSQYDFWQNVVQSAAAPLGGGSAIVPSASTIESLMLPLWIRLVRGIDRPDLIVMSDDYFTFYETSQSTLKRYTADESGKGGMSAMKYKGVDVIFDSSGGIPSSHAYFLNTNYLGVTVHPDANMSISDDNKSINQDAMVKNILWQGNLTVSNRARQGVLKA